MFNPLLVLAFLALVISNSTLAAAKVYNITVPHNTIAMFDPSSVPDISIDDTIVFYFESPSNPLANASSPSSTPCVPLIYKDDAQSFHPYPFEEAQNFTFTVDSTRAPIYYFSVTSNNCPIGLVGALNSPHPKIYTVKGIEQFIEAAFENPVPLTPIKKTIQERQTPTQPGGSLINTTGSTIESTTIAAVIPTTTESSTSGPTATTITTPNLSSLPLNIPPPATDTSSLPENINIDTSPPPTTSPPSIYPSSQSDTIQPPTPLTTLTISSTTTNPPFLATRPENTTPLANTRTTPSPSTPHAPAGLQTSHFNSGTPNHDSEGTTDFWLLAVALLLTWLLRP